MCEIGRAALRVCAATLVIKSEGGHEYRVSMSSSLLRTLSALVMLGAAVACDPYDSELLGGPRCGDGRLDDIEQCDIALLPGAQGACPTECESTEPCRPLLLVGSGCERQCAHYTITAARSGDGCCPAGVGPDDDGDCSECGDSIVQRGETCDPPESCPDDEFCDAKNGCAIASIVGDADQCTAECRYQIVRACVDDDGCCAAGCDADSDNDCSASCGNGIVDDDAGETCEPSSESMPCAESCDDADPCTLDMTTGSASGCNLTCVHQAITAAIDGDGCCPAGSDAASDADCSAACGNGVVEAGEQCEGGALCAADCSWALGLAHRYSFDEEGTTAFDAVGGAHGSVVNTQLTGAGVVALAGGTSEQFVSLPAGIVSTLVNATVEVWFSWRGGGDYQRIFDFGNNANGEGNQGGLATSFWALVANCYNGPLCVNMNFTPNAGDGGADKSADGTSVLATDVTYHVAVVFDDDHDSYRLYVDGALEATATGVIGHLSSIDDRNVWIGRSNFNDDEFNGRVDEFRIYARALTGAEIMQSFAAGPSP
jgi:hypothetical protein